MSKTLHRNLQSKMSALKGPEWDSSDEEEEAASKGGGGGRQSKADRKRAKKAQKQAESPISLKMDDGVSDDDSEDGGSENRKKKKNPIKKHEKPTVIYVGHLPVELEERDVRTFLTQFGDVVHSRISRSISTGHSRGYGFFQFADPEVAKIVAETLQGYFLGKKRLVCHLVDKPDDGLFFDTDRLVAQRKNDLQVERKRRRENLGNASKMKEITTRLVQREKKKRKKLQDLGIDYDFPGYEGSLKAQTDKENSEEPELSTPKSDKKKKKQKKRSDSVSSMGSANSSSSATKKSKRKDSIGSVGSSGSKSKRKDSIGSAGSNASSSSKKKKKSRRHSDAGDNKAGTSKKVEETTSTPKSSGKKKKSKKSRKSL